MIHHQVHIFLAIRVKTVALRNNPADQFVITLRGPSDSAGFSDLEMTDCFLSGAVLHFSREANVSGRKEVVIHVVVEGLITTHDNIPVVGWNRSK